MSRILKIIIMCIIIIGIFNYNNKHLSVINANNFNCWRCNEEYNRTSARNCNECGWDICNKCGACSYDCGKSQSEVSSIGGRILVLLMIMGYLLPIVKFIFNGPRNTNSTNNKNLSDKNDKLSSDGNKVNNISAYNDKSKGSDNFHDNKNSPKKNITSSVNAQINYTNTHIANSIGYSQVSSKKIKSNVTDEIVVKWDISNMKLCSKFEIKKIQSNNIIEHKNFGRMLVKEVIGDKAYVELEDGTPKIFSLKLLNENNITKIYEK